MIASTTCSTAIPKPALATDPATPATVTDDATIAAVAATAVPAAAATSPIPMHAAIIAAIIYPSHSPYCFLNSVISCFRCVPGGS